MFNKKMAVLCSDAADAPPYLAPRELALARARVRKAALIEKCRVCELHWQTSAWMLCLTLWMTVWL
jgi:hypothetical protein